MAARPTVVSDGHSIHTMPTIRAILTARINKYQTGKPYVTTAMVLRHDPETHEAVICSAWGQDADWIRNIRVRPALRVQLGRESFTPQQRFLSEDEGLAVVTEFRHRHPGRIRLMSWILGWGDLRSDAAVRSFVRTRPFVSLRPADSS